MEHPSEENVRRYLRRRGASLDEIDDFRDWCTQLCRAQQEEAVEKRIRYSVYRLWAKLLWKRQTLFHYKDVFIYDDSLKNYIRHLTGASSHRRASCRTGSTSWYKACLVNAICRVCCPSFRRCILRHERTFVSIPFVNT